MEVIFTPQAKKGFKKLSKITQILVFEKLKRLRSGVFVGAEKLTDYRGVYRIRIGDYRIVYRTMSGKRYIVLVGHRKEVYALLKRLWS